ncbi:MULTISPECIES: ABC transporter ATP-binding protein [unclassified Nocardioides]|uniref:ABC transporter ATP-binding protein n=1 Tax=unclassified Nocardioides TaxID=2615069 RepID=UPI002405AFEE|nr:MULTISPECIES: ABC transporter ATP-binding protein [unclassified Nocardioides]MDF9716973.1 ABC transporter ATP-binding protein [Nocardioides sp. ChNu-99]
MSGLVADLDVPGRLRAAVRAEEGDVLVVVGPNGSGKTTLLRCLAGLLPGGPAEVAVAVGGRCWTSPLLLPRDRRVGYVVQGQALFPHLDARENVAFGLRARGVERRAARDRADAELERLGVGHLAERRPGELSGGQAQRVAIARALATDPELLLLDEPFAGLDVGVAATLRVELARHLATYGGTTVLVTHDAVDALALGTRMLVLEDGRVAQEGTPAEVAARPRTDHVARLVGLNLVPAGPAGLAAFRPSAVTLSPGAPTAPSGSARLRWRGRVEQVVPYGDGVRVSVRTSGDGPDALLADVTAAAVAELGLHPGVEVWASAKETAVTRYPAGAADDAAPTLRSGHGD